MKLMREWQNFTIQLVANGIEVMPRTSFVFINDEPNLSESEKSMVAKSEASAALQAYWNALEGTIDP